MDHISGPDHSTLPTHQTRTQTRTLSRRRLLAGAAGGVAVVAAGQPAWAADATRPGAVRGPALAVRDRPGRQGIRPSRALRRPAGALRAHRTAHRRHRLGEGGRGVRTHLAAQRRLPRRPARALRRRRQVPRRHRRPRRPARPTTSAGRPGPRPTPDSTPRPVTGRVVDVKAATAPTWPTDPAAVTGAVVLADDAQDADAATRGSTCGRRSSSRRSGAGRRPSSCCRPTWPTPAAHPRRRRGWCRPPARPRRPGRPSRPSRSSAWRRCRSGCCARTCPCARCA